jgi:hypothetical protein
MTRNEMTTTVDPFEIVRDWWGNRPVTSEVEKFGIDPSTREGAFECVILGILFAIDDTGDETIRDTLDTLRDNGMTNISTLASLSSKPGIQADLDGIMHVHYFNGRRRQDKIRDMEEAANRISHDHDLEGDVRRLHRKCNGNGEQMIRWLKSSGLGRKRFWLLREMRIGGVWDVGGAYCCVPDKQVETSLDRWHKHEPKESLRSLLECSRIVWEYFGKLYDYPVFKYSRHFKCNDARQRNGSECRIENCKERRDRHSLCFKG